MENAGPGVWVGAPVPTDYSTGADRPSAVRPIVSPPRGLITGSREWKETFRDFSIIMMILINVNDIDILIQGSHYDISYSYYLNLILL